MVGHNGSKVVTRAALVVCVLGTTAGVATGPALRTATSADDAAHRPVRHYTEWWYANAIDPATGLAVALSLGADSPGRPPTSVAFLFLPSGRAVALVAPRMSRSVSRERADVRLGGDRFEEGRPGEWRVLFDAPSSLALFGGSPGPVRVDLRLRAQNPGFAAGPLSITASQSMSWTVAAPAALADGSVRVGGTTFPLHGALAYHDHNFGPFDLADPAHGGWDWSELRLPGRRSLVLGLVKPADRARTGGVLVLSGAKRRLGQVDQRGFRVAYARWARVGGFVYPSEERVVARLSGAWSVRVRYRARAAAPLGLADHALVEVLARGDGELRRGSTTLRFRDAPGVYEYESTPAVRARDGAP